MRSRWLCYALALALVIQGLTVAAERVAPGGHFHLASLAVHAHDDDDHHADPHHGGGHFHSAIGYHAHAPHDDSVVHVDEGNATTTEAAIALKRLALDHEQLSTITPAPEAPIGVRAPFVLRVRGFRSHVTDPLEPPPRLSAS